MKYTEIQITTDNYGHCINSIQCISPDGQWIVYDTRNNDTLLASTGEIRMVNAVTRENKLLYKTIHQTQYGPGVGAATFSPDGKKVLFLGGIQNADSLHPYSIARRTGIAVDITHPMVPIWMDARDIIPPFTPGALRGGTHAHSWSGDGQWVSFTYNDFILQQSGLKNPNIKDMRTVGLMFPSFVEVKNADGIENKNGQMFAVLIAKVKNKPVSGSDEINKAFDECWIGKNGYRKKDGTLQKKAIAFQGNVIAGNGKNKTEIFVVDIPENLPKYVDSMSLAGTSTTLPATPKVIVQRRISFMNEGVSETPRHWLRTLPNGALIGFLSMDKKKTIQLWGISPNGGEAFQLTDLPYSIEGQFNFSPDGKMVAYIADGSVFITVLSDKKSYRVTPKSSSEEYPVGAVVWSSDGNKLVYNRYMVKSGKKFLQIFLLKKN